jgi:hypothetical protein
MIATPKRRPIIRPEGVNPTEQHLKRLADSAFLTPWGYPEVRNDKGRRDGKGDGDEVCDYLVIFENDVFIFSVKGSAFSESSDLATSWNRWFRRVVKESLGQIRGAERWLKTHPGRVFVDRACEHPFPLPIPNPDIATYHRIAVMHGAADRCRQERGGRGSLRLVPAIVGTAHHASPEGGGEPFAIGQLDPSLGFVHVLDETSLDIVLTELDTIADFLAYLTWKERLVASGRIERVAGELELLAYYLGRVRDTEQYLPPLPAGVDRLVLEEGLWEDFAQSAERASRRGENASSYLIDRLIERTSQHAYAGTEHSASTPGIAGAAKILRFLAREPRTRRRGLGRAVDDLFRGTAEDDFAAVRIIHPSLPSEPHYVLLLVSPTHSAMSYDEYQDMRRWMLGEHCRAVRYLFPDATDVVGIATDLSASGGSSEVVAYYDGRSFTEQDANAARDFIAETGALQNLTHSDNVEAYFPGTT